MFIDDFCLDIYVLALFREFRLFGILKKFIKGCTLILFGGFELLLSGRAQHIGLILFGRAHHIDFSANFV